MDSNQEEVMTRGRNLLLKLYENNGELTFEETSKILGEFRVITREKTLGLDFLDERCLKTLVNYAKECQTEAQKSLSNLILNYEHIREPLVGPYTECVKRRLTQIYNDQHQCQKTSLSKSALNETLYYDLRIIFLLSALCPKSRTKIRDKLADLIFIVISKEADEILQDNQLILIEALKAAFNLTIEKCVNVSLACDVIKKLFSVIETQVDEANNNSSQASQLLINLIHLLTNMPESVYLELPEEGVVKILIYLDDQLKKYPSRDLRDSVLPVLNVCSNICKLNESTRKNWFNRILGSSDDFDKRPEECDSLRGRLVRLMTSVDILQKDMAADFLYELCDRNAEKFITYTGFGNAAAFLSARGLLSKSEQGSTNASDNTNVEESFKELQQKVDPITGKIGAPRGNPMEGMSEEEKEFHAHELANAITRLANLGVIKPMQLNAEGNISDIEPKGSDRTN